MHWRGLDPQHGHGHDGQWRRGARRRGHLPVRGGRRIERDPDGQGRRASRRPSLKLELYDNYCQQMLTRTGSSISVTSVLPGNGLYMVSLSSTGGDGGRYTFTLAGKAPNMKWTQNGSIPTQMSVYDRTMAMPKGTLLTATVSSTKFQPTLQVLDPARARDPAGRLRHDRHGQGDGEEPADTGRHAELPARQLRPARGLGQHATSAPSP